MLMDVVCFIAFRKLFQIFSINMCSCFYFYFLNPQGSACKYAESKVMQKCPRLRDLSVVLVSLVSSSSKHRHAGLEAISWVTAPLFSPFPRHRRITLFISAFSSVLAVLVFCPHLGNRSQMLQF